MKLARILLTAAVAALPLAQVAAEDHAAAEHSGTEEHAASHEEKPKPKAKRRSAALVVNPDPRGEPELTICSQNLQNFGTYAQSKSRLYNLSPAQFDGKREALVARFKKAGCDVVAVQELLGKDVEEAEGTLKQLASGLRAKTNRIYDVIAAETNDPLSRVGFIVARDRAEIVNKVSYSKVELPKIVPQERPRLFIRAPFELQLNVKGRGDSPAKTVNVVTFHFKSKAGKDRDPTDLEWETYRIQMAEALRRVIEARFSEAFGSGETLLAVLGDRNSNYDAASAKVLEGALVMKQFQGEPVCRLSKRGLPICRKDTALPQRLFSVISGDPKIKTTQGTYRYKDVYSFLDDILLPAESLRTAWKKFDREGEYDAGILREPAEASDHAMVYVRLNW